MKILASLIDAIGELLLRLASRCFDAACTLDPAILDAHHPQVNDQMVAQLLDRLHQMEPTERASVLTEAAELAHQSNRPVYLLPSGAMRRWVN